MKQREATSTSSRRCSYMLPDNKKHKCGQHAASSSFFTITAFHMTELIKRQLTTGHRRAGSEHGHYLNEWLLEETRRADEKHVAGDRRLGASAERKARGEQSRQTASTAHSLTRRRRSRYHLLPSLFPLFPAGHEKQVTRKALHFFCASTSRRPDEKERTSRNVCGINDAHVCPASPQKGREKDIFPPRIKMKVGKQEVSQCVLE